MADSEFEPRPLIPTFWPLHHTVVQSTATLLHPASFQSEKYMEAEGLALVSRQTKLKLNSVKEATSEQP